MPELFFEMFSSSALTGPLSSLLIASIGARWTVFIGVCMTMFGYFASAFVDSFGLMCLTYGVIAGVGVGFTYLPGVVMLGFYFNRYRNFAFGIVTMAVGIGQMCLAPLINFLLDLYGWRGTMIILSGITAHFAIAGAVLRPIDFDPEFLYDDAEDDDDVMVDPSTEKGMLNCTFNRSNDSVSTGGSLAHLSTTTSKLPRNLSENLIQHGVPNLSLGLKPVPTEASQGLLVPNVSSVKIEDSCPLIQGITINKFDNSLINCTDNNQLNNHHGHSRIYYPKHLRVSNVTGPDKFHSSASIYLGSSTSISHPAARTISQSSYNINNCNFPYRLHSSPVMHHRMQSPRMHRIVSPLQRVLNEDGILARISSDFIGRSYSSINDITRASMPQLSDIDESFVDSSIDNTQAPSKLQEAMVALRNPKFVLYCFSLFAVTLGQGVVYLHMPAFAISTGTSAQRASNLIAVMGLANIISRFLSGVVTSGNRCSNLTVYNISLTLNGAFLLVAPNMGQTYLGQVAVAAIFSLFGNCYCAIMTPLAIEIVGLPGLSIASGILLLASGVGYLIGAPIAGMLFDISGSYTTTFYFAGLCVLVGVLIMLAVSVLVKRERNKEYS